MLTKYSDMLTKRQPAVHRPNQARVNEAKAMAVWWIHQAINEETGADLPFDRTTGPYQLSLKQSVTNIVEGRI